MSNPAEQIMSAMEALYAIAEALHGLGTAAVSGAFTIEGECVKWLADKIQEVTSELSDVRETVEAGTHPEA